MRRMHSIAICWSAIWLASLATMAGCDHLQDVTTTDRVQAGGIIGRCFELKEDAIVVRHDRPNWVRLEPASNRHSYESGGGLDGSILGSADRGTRIRVVQAALFNFGWLPSPAMAPSDIPITFAQVLDGPFTGKTVEVKGLNAIYPDFNAHRFHLCSDAGSNVDATTAEKSGIEGR